MRETAAVTLVMMLVASGAADARVYDRGKQCIPAHEVRATTALYDDELAFHMDGGRAFISHLPKPCDTLKAINVSNTLRLPRTDRYCAGDRIEVVENGAVPELLGGERGGTETCALGRFEPIQEVMLPESLQR